MAACRGETGQANRVTAATATCLQEVTQLDMSSMPSSSTYNDCANMRPGSMDDMTSCLRGGLVWLRSPDCGSGGRRVRSHSGSNFPPAYPPTYEQWGGFYPTDPPTAPPTTAPTTTEGVTGCGAITTPTMCASAGCAWDISAGSGTSDEDTDDLGIGVRGISARLLRLLLL